MALIPSTPQYPATRRKGEGGPGFRARPCAPLPLLPLSYRSPSLAVRPFPLPLRGPSWRVGAPGAEGRVPCPLVRIVCPSGSFAGPPWKAGVRHGVWGHGVNATAPFLAPHEGGAPPSHDLAARPSVPVGAPGPDSPVSPVHGRLGASWGWFRDVQTNPVFEITLRATIV